MHKGENCKCDYINNMEFCDVSCLICDEKKCFPVNFGGYHKACRKHWAELESLIFTQCRKCNSYLLVIKDLIPAKNLYTADQSNSPVKIVEVSDALNAVPENSNLPFKPLLSSNSQFGIVENRNLPIKFASQKQAFGNNLNSLEEDNKIFGIPSIAAERKYDLSSCVFCRKTKGECFLKCGHEVCMQCRGNYRYCFICYDGQLKEMRKQSLARKSFLVSCHSCGLKCQEFRTLECKHRVCTQCQKTFEKCKACKVFCFNCGNGNADQMINNCVHKYCRRCRDDHVKCTICVPHKL